MMGAMDPSREEQETLLSNEQKVEAFLSYLELENYDMLAICRLAGSSWTRLRS